MAWISALLNVIPNTRCENMIVTTVSDERDPFGIFGARSYFETKKDTSYRHLKTNEIGKTKISKLKKLLNSRQLAEEKFGRAVYTLGDARKRLKDEDFYVGAATFLEQVFGQNDRHFRTLAVRAAWLLGSDRKDRLQLSDQIYNIIRIRNDVVHKGSIESSNKRRVDRTLHDRLCTEIIREIAAGNLVENLEYGR